MHLNHITHVLAITASTLLGSAMAYDSPWGIATITLISPGAQNTFTIPQDGTPYAPQFTDSTSWISTSSQLISIAKHCELKTRSGGTYALSELGFNYFAFGPPQVISSIACWNPNLRKDWTRPRPSQSGKARRDASVADVDAVQERSEVNDALSLAGLEARQAGGGSHSRRWAYLTFLGAADASYSIAVSYFGQLAVIPGWQPFDISVSQITSLDINIEKYCFLQTVNAIGPIRDLGPNRWQISPPTRVTGASCYCDFTKGSCI